MIILNFIDNTFSSCVFVSWLPFSYVYNQSTTNSYVYIPKHVEFTLAMWNVQDK